MRKWIIVSLITLIFVCFILFRIVIPFQSTFTSEGVQLNTVDAYYMVRYAGTFPNIPQWDYFINYPSGAPPISQLSFPVIVALVSKLLSIDTLTADAILPPFFMIFILLGVFAICKILFTNNLVSLVAVFLLTIMPGEIMYRTMLGGGDYHCLEILLLTTTLLCLFLAIKYRNDRKWFILFCFCALLGAFDYISAWVGGVLIVFIVGVFLLALIVTKRTKYSFLLYAIIPFILIVFTACYYIGNIQMFTYYVDNMVRVFVPNITTVIDEEMPLFFTSGRFDWIPMWNYFGIVFYLFLFGIGVLINNYVKYKKPEILFLLVWTLIILAMTFAERRFAYYLAINIAVITAYVVVLVLSKVWKRATLIKCVVGLSLVVIVPFARIDIVMADFGRMPKEWHECTEWLNYQRYQGDATDFVIQELYYKTGSKSGYGVLSWWDYGNWIVVKGRTPALCTPFNQDFGVVSGILTEANMPKAVNRLKELELKYVIITDEMFKDKLYPILSAAKVNVDKIVLSDLFMYKLFYYNNVENVRKVWQSSNDKVKVFAVR